MSGGAGENAGVRDGGRGLNARGRVAASSRNAQGEREELRTLETRGAPETWEVPQALKEREARESREAQAIPAPPEAEGTSDGRATPATADAQEARRGRMAQAPSSARLSPAPKRTTRTGRPKEGGQRAQRVKEKAYEKTPDRFKNASSFQVRLRTGIIYIALNIVCILASDVTTMIVLAATSAMCAGELYYMMRSDAKMPNELIGVVGAAAYPVAAFFLGIIGLVCVSALLVLAVTVWYVYWLRARLTDVGMCLFGAVYTGFQLSGLMFIRMAVDGVWGGVVVLIVFFSIWMNDAGAYVIGSRFGRHKLAPRTSPNKSWEGFIAGLVVSMGFWCLLLAVPGVEINVWECLAFGLACGLTSVLGDLCESRIKRSVGFKDSGNIMPGHGGLFDRCDSLMPTAVVAALLLFGAGCLPMPF